MTCISQFPLTVVTITSNCLPRSFRWGDQFLSSSWSLR